MAHQSTTDRHTTVAIVGAGIAGLTAARALYRQGIEVLVLEAADRVGGRMMAETSAVGSRVDLGGQWIGHGHHRFASLAAELGTTVYPTPTPRRTAIVHDGRAMSLLRPATTVAVAALLAVELSTRLRMPKRWASITVADWLQKLPSPLARRLLEVLLEVAPTADLDRFSMSAFAETVRFQGGLFAMLSTKGGAQDSLILEAAGTLTEKIAAELDGRVLLNTPVTAIDRDEGGVIVRSPSALVRASKVVICLPPPLLDAIAFDPPLPPRFARSSRETYMGSVYKAIAVYDTPFWRQTADEALIRLDKPAGGAVFDTSPPAGPGHLCILVGGRQARALDHLKPEDRRDAVLRPIATALSSPAILEPASWHEKAWHLDPYVRGGYSALPNASVIANPFPVPSDPVGNTLYWAGTETAVEHAGYIEGAIESAQRAVQQVIEDLQ